MHRSHVMRLLHLTGVGCLFKKEEEERNKKERKRDH